MGRKKFFVFAMVLIFLIVPVALAQTPDETNTNSETTQTEITPTTATDKRPGDDKMEERKQNLNEKTEQNKENLIRKGEERKASFLERLEIKKKEAQNQMQLRKKEFHEKLAAIKEQRKKQLLQRIQDKTAQINTKRTDFMSAVLEKLASILARSEARVSDAKSRGINTTAAESAIAIAKQKIDQAKSSLESQAGQTYSLEIQSETTLKATVGQTVSELESDLKSAHALVVAAKQAVSDAVHEVTKLHERPKLNPTEAILPIETLEVSLSP